MNDVQLKVPSKNIDLKGQTTFPVVTRYTISEKTTEGLFVEKGSYFVETGRYETKTSEWLKDYLINHEGYNVEILVIRKETI